MPFPFSNNAEGGVDGSVPTTSDGGSGDDWFAVNNGGVAGRIEYTTADSVSPGSKSYRCYTRGTGELENVVADAGSGQSSLHGRVYIKPTLTPSTSYKWLQVKEADAGFILFYLYHRSTGDILLRNGADTVSIWTGPVIVANRWYRVEFYVDPTLAAADSYVQIRVFVEHEPVPVLGGNSGLQIVAGSGSASTVRQVRCGVVTADVNVPGSGGSDYLYFDQLALGSSAIGASVSPPATGYARRGLAAVS